jgi:hypothetical protein
MVRDRNLFQNSTDKLSNDIENKNGSKETQKHLKNTHSLGKISYATPGEEDSFCKVVLASTHSY